MSDVDGDTVAREQRDLDAFFAEALGFVRNGATEWIKDVPRGVATTTFIANIIVATVRQPRERGLVYFFATGRRAAGLLADEVERATGVETKRTRLRDSPSHLVSFDEGCAVRIFDKPRWSARGGVQPQMGWTRVTVGRDVSGVLMVQLH